MHTHWHGPLRSSSNIVTLVKLGEITFETTLKEFLNLYHESRHATGNTKSHTSHDLFKLFLYLYIFIYSSQFG